MVSRPERRREVGDGRRPEVVSRSASLETLAGKCSVGWRGSAERKMSAAAAATRRELDWKR